MHIDPAQDSLHDLTVAAKRRAVSVGLDDEEVVHAVHDAEKQVDETLKKSAEVETQAPGVAE